MKLKQKLSASKILWWDRHRIDISIPKGRKEKELSTTSSSKFEIQQSKFLSISVARGSVLWPAQLCLPLCLQPPPLPLLLPLYPCSCPQSQFSFCLKGSTRLHLNSSISSFLKCRILEVRLPSCTLFSLSSSVEAGSISAYTMVSKTLWAFVDVINMYDQLTLNNDYPQ